MNQNNSIKIIRDGDILKIIHSPSNGTLMCLIKNDRCYAKSTVVDPEFQGQGIAKKLFLELLTYTKEHHLVIVPECSYIKYQMEQI